MPRLVHARPRYRQHRASKQAIVEIAGHTHYLGPYGSAESQTKYDGLVSEWLAAGRPVKWRPAEVVPAEPQSVPPAPRVEPAKTEVLPVLSPVATPMGECSVLRLIKEFWRFAKGRYVTFGRVTGTHQNYKPVLKLLRRCCGHLKVTIKSEKPMKRQMTLITIAVAFCAILFWRSATTAIDVDPSDAPGVGPFFEVSTVATYATQTGDRRIFEAMNSGRRRKDGSATAPTFLMSAAFEPQTGEKGLLWEAATAPGGKVGCGCMSIVSDPKHSFGYVERWPRQV